MSNAAEIVIAKCGGARIVAEMADVDVSRVHRWTYPKDRGGTGGIIPAKHQGPILDAARKRGIDLSPADFFPPPLSSAPAGEGAGASEDDTSQSDAAA